jgi:hypothetical protein
MQSQSVTNSIEIQRLVTLFASSLNVPQDNIVILFDEANGDPEVESFLTNPFYKWRVLVGTKENLIAISQTGKTN